MVAKVFPRYAPLDVLPEADMDDRATWLEYVIPGAAGEIIVGNGLGAVPQRKQGNTLWLPLTGGTVTGQVNIATTLYIYGNGVPLRVRRANETDEIFCVAPDVGAAGVLLRSAIDFTMCRDSAGNTTVFRVDGQNGQIFGGGSAPTITPLTAQLGSGGTASINWGNDTFMYVIINGGSGGVMGSVATVNFWNDRPTATYGVWIQEYSGTSTDAGKVYAGTHTTSGFNIQFRFVPVSGQSYHYLCFVGGPGA